MGAKDVVDARCTEPFSVADLACEAGLAGAHEGRPYGLDAAYLDPSGNHIRLAQLRLMP